MPVPPRHVAVLGGGLLGVSTATQLAERGVAVTVITDGELASGASGRSLSWLNSAAERSPAYHRLRMIGIDRPVHGPVGHRDQGHGPRDPRDRVPGRRG